jgi:hypothetical protein
MGMSIPASSCRSTVRCQAPATGVDCLVKLPGTCVYYSGTRITGPGINTGDNLNVLVQKIIDYIDSHSPAGSGLNEIVTFTDQDTLTLSWNATRKARFGDAAIFRVEMVGEDGIYREVGVQAVPDSGTDTTSYEFDFGGTATGRIIIS